jgi:hypothetical protein
MQAVMPSCVTRGFVVANIQGSEASVGHQSSDPDLNLHVRAQANVKVNANGIMEAKTRLGRISLNI